MLPNTSKLQATAAILSCLVAGSTFANSISQVAQTVAASQQRVIIKSGNGSVLNLSDILPRITSVSHMKWCPLVRKVSFVADNQYLWVLDTQTQIPRLLGSVSEGKQNLVNASWSEDGKWLKFDAETEKGIETKYYGFQNNKTYSHSISSERLAVNGESLVADNK